MRLVAAFLCLLLVACNGAESKPKNIIMVVGDGMGPAYTTAYRYFADSGEGNLVPTTVFDRNLVGMSSTYPDRVSGYVTDSAAGATALASATKSYNGAIGVDVDKRPTLSVLEWAKLKGMKTGVAVTSQINHATPASYGAHNESRRNYNEIADSYFDEKLNGAFVMDVMLGGGWEYFIRDDRNLVEEFKQSGYQYVDKLDDLSTVMPGKPLLGLFGDTGMAWALDTPQHTRLASLTQAAVKQLENEKGFFLLVEASQVDWAGHANDIAAAMAEMHDMALTLEWLEQYVAEHPDTLVVITADHSTGGMTLAADGKYAWNPEWLKKLSASPQIIAEKLVDAENKAQLAESLLGFSLNEDESKALAETNNKMRPLYTWVRTTLDKRSNTGWTTGGHTAVDVPVFAMGQWRDRFAGHINNTDIPKVFFEMMGKDQ